ncbi:MAG: xanthine dehydrogenase family protein molybdopterin-binding subunit [Ancalomicrobiaceae bacterium]|nr:xanthine dehydrogenase family protein molybdopterin-binding subunit [Ancalomicrobiaceae bacterium]
MTLMTSADIRDAASAILPINLSRRGFLGGTIGSLIVGLPLPGAEVLAATVDPAAKPGIPVSAFLEIRPDNTVLLRSVSIEGGQGIYTAYAQVVGEDLDVEPSKFSVECAPAGPDYLVMNGRRFTGGSRSIRTNYELMRKLGATCRQMLLQAAANRLQVPLAELSTQPGRVIHAATGRTLDYGALAIDAAALPMPADPPLRADKDFRWIGKPVARLDVYDKSTGKAIYAIDVKVDGMLQAAVRHAPLRGSQPGDLLNEAEVKAMPGVHSVHRLAGAVAVVADRWWHAHRAVEALQLTWVAPAAGTPNSIAADFSSTGMQAKLAAAPGPGITALAAGDTATALRTAAHVIEATYDAPYLVHGQLEPPSALARFNDDGTLELWLPNQAPEQFQHAAAAIAGLKPEQVAIHSPLIGGFFGRHSLYEGGSALPQAIRLAKAVGRPVKVIWSREEEFLKDAMRPMGLVRFRAAVDASGNPVALEIEAVGEGPSGRLFSRKPDAVDASVVDGFLDKPYAIANRRVGFVPVSHPTSIGFWRSVGHSMNDFFYEGFLDEIAETLKQDPFELRQRLVADKPRQRALLQAVADLSGGWKRGPFTAPDGSRRARGIAMASPFGSETANIAEVSVKDGTVNVHDVWVAFDPGRAVNPAIIEAQVKGATALGVSTALLEQMVYDKGIPTARNFDGYPILPPDRMPNVHVRIVESGAPLGGVGEPGLPGVPPAVVNAVAALTGQRIRSLPLSKYHFGSVG